MNSQRPSVAGEATASAVDIYATGIALLCLVHCLALPLLASSVSLAVPFAQSELVHKALVMTAAPATLFAIHADARLARRRLFIRVASIGLALLVAAAFVPALEAFEQPVTVAGSVILASAHVWRAMDARAKRARACDDNAD